ncbi:hypothetical protein ACFOG5_08430 [Pedobacter fastidiosus]|uniref:hypothetical protein n=1 Tax=Pedobacter fastidiosus TaxID=2765361 RepID=UPI00361824DD
MLKVQNLVFLQGSKRVTNCLPNIFSGKINYNENKNFQLALYKKTIPCTALF